VEVDLNPFSENKYLLVDYSTWSDHVLYSTAKSILSKSKTIDKDVDQSWSRINESWITQPTN